MAPYGSLEYFYLVAALAIPALIGGFTGRRLKHYTMVVSVVMCVVLVSEFLVHMLWLGGFFVFEAILMKVYLRYRTGLDRESARSAGAVWIARGAAVAATVPLVITKMGALFPSMSVGFLGISYLSFKAIQVILEITDGLITEYRLLDYVGFIAFFPTMSSGPIDRSRRFTEDAERAWSRAEYSALLARGLGLLLLGAVYKFVLAGLCYGFVQAAPNAWAYMYAYSGQLFFDFAGYSAMAVGLSHVFGVRTPMNFRLPFAAESIKEFWNRWHVTLSFWFRDYLYSRLVMWLIRRKTFKDRAWAGRLSMMINMTLMGFWHGFTAHYILYGLYHGVLLVANDIFEKRSSFYQRHHKATWYRVLAILVTAHVVMFGFLLFSGHIIPV